MVNTYNTFDMGYRVIGRISLEESLKSAIECREIIPPPDYLKKGKIKENKKFVAFREQDNGFRFLEVATVMIIRRLLGIERISHFENEILLKSYFNLKIFQATPLIIITYNGLIRKK